MAKYFLIGLIIFTFVSLFYLFFIRSKDNIDKTIEDEEKTMEDQEKTMEDQEKTIENQAKTIRNHLDSAIAVLVLACSRVTVARCIDQLLKFRPSVQQFPIIVSQDCHHNDTANVIRGYGDQVLYIRLPYKGIIEVPDNIVTGYRNIARHYVWALNVTFFHFNFTKVIIVEDDLNISPDFFEYFLGTLPIMQADPTLWCISAWNDNGKLDLIQKDAPQLLHRTDFFPGLGWMLTKNTWAELAPKWPRTKWDEWIRRPNQTKGRGCIRPEISRTTTFGKTGVSGGLFYEEFLKYIHLNEKFVPFTRLNLTYLLKDNYDAQFNKSVNESKIISYPELGLNKFVNDGSVRIVYCTWKQFQENARKLGLMGDLWFGVPRTGYKAVVSFYYNNRRVYLAPNTTGSECWQGIHNFEITTEEIADDYQHQLYYNR